MLDRPLHIISSNPHSVMNSLYAHAAIEESESMDLEALASELSQPEKGAWRKAVEAYALENGMYQLVDKTGTNLTVQVFDTTQIKLEDLPSEITWDSRFIEKNKPLLVVMDYAFGEQAYEGMDELLKPYEPASGKKIPLRFASISIMGKAGILMGDKGDIMVPTAHVFEGTADNYPFQNGFSKKDFEGYGLGVCEGPMITVLGTSLQNKDILRYFLKSSWQAIGLEMEGAHYQKAIQAASQIRNSANPDVRLRYAYYASDNPLVSGHTLASGALGVDGVKPTYLITVKILNAVFVIVT